MYCNHCGCEFSKDTIYCPQCGDLCKEEEKRENFGRLQKGLVIGTILLLIIAFTAIGLYFLFWQSPQRYELSTSSEVSINKLLEKNEQNKEIKTPTPNVNTDEELPQSESDAQSDNEMKLVFGVTLDSLDIAPYYTAYTNENFGYTYIVPQSFACESVMWEREKQTKTYCADNGTAVLQMIGYDNKDDQLPQDIIKEIKAAANVSPTSATSGEDWFACSYEKKNVIYYIKGFVGSYVCMMVFYYPKEYHTVYDRYAEDMEDDFKRHAEESATVVAPLEELVNGDTDTLPTTEGMLTEDEKYKIKKIKEWYAVTNSKEESNSFAYVEVKGKYRYCYNESYEPELIDAAVSEGEKYTRKYYIYGGELYFVFDFENQTQNRFYFHEGRLIRWITGAPGSQTIYDQWRSSEAYCNWEQRIFNEYAEAIAMQ